MHSLFHNLVKDVPFTDSLKENVHLFLTLNQCPKTAEHCINVGKEARRVAERFGANPDSAEIAGWLHDISAVFPSRERIQVSRALQIEVLPEEETFPMIIHQKISKVMARDIFGIEDSEILEAIGCHTTLRARSKLLDQVVFVADKIAWDQDGRPPYLEALTEQLQRSLKHGAFAYIHYLWERKETLKVIHPWLKEAYDELKAALHG